MELLSYILFALALNLDSFVSGVAYGARQIKVPLLSLFIISLISSVVICVSMLGGRVLLAFIPAIAARRFGGILLLLIGLWVLYQARRGRSGTETATAQDNSLQKMIKIHIRPLGLVIQILREPARADLDSSGVISPRESLILGVALAMDAFGAGFSFSLLGFSTAVTAPLIGIGQFFLTYLGILAGRTLTATKIARQLTALPGFILISIGLLKIY